MTQIIEGTWEELVRREDLKGRRLRVILIDDAAPRSMSPAEWVERLRAWAGSHAPVGHFVDVSRQGVYGGSVDDPR